MFQLPQVSAPLAQVSGLRTGIRQSEPRTGRVFKTRVRVAAGGVPKVQGGDTGAENGTLKVLGMQQVPGNAVLHVHPEGRG